MSFLTKSSAFFCLSFNFSGLTISNCSEPGEYLISCCCSARLSVNSLSALAGTVITSLYRSRRRLKFLSAPGTSILFATIRVGLEIFLSIFANCFVSCET